MNRSTKAAFLSALVFPGTGHLYLHSYSRGIILLAICTVALTDFIRRAWHEAELIRTQINAEINATGIIDLESLLTHATTAVDRIDHQPFTLATIVLVACWVIAIFDSYRIGKNMPSPPTPLPQGKGRKTDGIPPSP